MESTPSQPRPPQESSVGPLVGVVIIVALLVAGGIYFFMTNQQENGRQNPENSRASAADENLVVSPNAF